MNNQARNQPNIQTGGQFKLLIGGLVILAAIVYLIISSTQANAEYYLTVNELMARKTEMTGREIRISGAVLGNTIRYDSDNVNLHFTVAHIPGNNEEIETQGGIARVLHDATKDPNRNRLEVIYNGVKPDLLKNEAQAIMRGKLGSDGIFIANELLLKCPTRYDDARPESQK